MPHKCTRCGRIYTEKDEQILHGCECGNGMFLYFRKLEGEEARKLEEEEEARKVKDRALYSLVDSMEEAEKRFDDLGNIRVREGVYEIDLGSLMGGEPIIVEGDEGEYLVSLSSLFEEKSRLKKYLDILRK